MEAALKTCQREPVLGSLLFMATLLPTLCGILPKGGRSLHTNKLWGRLGPFLAFALQARCRKRWEIPRLLLPMQARGAQGVAGFVLGRMLRAVEVQTSHLAHLRTIFSSYLSRVAVSSFLQGSPCCFCLKLDCGGASVPTTTQDFLPKLLPSS